MKTKKGLLVLILLALTFVLGFALTACGEDPPAPEPTSFTVTFNTDEGSSVAAQTVAKDGKVVEPVSPTKSGHTFGGWYKDGAYANVWSFATDTVTADTTIYAKWTAVEVVTYTVTFESNCDDSVSSYTDVVEGSAIKRPDDAFSKEHHTFGGWFLDDGTFKEAWRFGGDKVTSDITLYAKWDAVSYTVTFNTDKGSNIADEKVEYNTPANKPSDPNKEGYTFGGWYSDKECTDGKEWNFTSNITGDTEIFAKWTAKKYDVAYVRNDGTEITGEEKDYGSHLTEPKEPIREHYTFVAWFKDIALKTEWDFEKDTIKGNTTLYAKWIADDHKIKFNANGGKLANGDDSDFEIVKYGEYIPAQGLPTKENAAFNGWYLNSEGTGAAWSFTGNKVESDMTLYVKWLENAVTVTFETNGGDTADFTRSVAKDGVIGSAVASRKGYKFAGWFTDTELTVPFDTSKDKVTAAMTLYAKWEGPMSFTLNADGKSYTLKSYNAEALEEVLDTIEIPSVHPDDNLPITAIGANCFESNPAKQIIFAEKSQITTIGAYAFRNCRSLTSLIIPDSVTEIGNYLFNNCYSLTSLTLSESITTLPSYFIYVTSKLTTLDIPASVTTIKADAFSQSYVTVFVPNGNITVEASAFSGYFHGTVIVPFAAEARPETWNATWAATSANVVYGYDTKPNIINNVIYAIEGENAVVSNYVGRVDYTTIPDTVTIEGKPYTVTTIKTGAFRNNNLLVKVDLPSSIMTIESGAFDTLSKLRVIWVPSKVTTIAEDAIKSSSNANIFTDVASVESKPVGWATTATTYYGTITPEIVEDMYVVAEIDGEVTILVEYGTFSRLEFPTKTPSDKKITAIPADIPSGYSMLVIPEGYTTIGANAIKTIGDLYIPSSITSMGSAAINATSTDAKRIYIGDTKEAFAAKIGKGIASDWLNKGDNSALEIIYGVPQPEWHDDVLYVKVGDNEAYALMPRHGATDVNILGKVTLGGQECTVTTVGYRFGTDHKTIIKTVTIGEGVTTIERSALASITTLLSVTLPTSLVEIGANAFNGCTSLKEIVIPKSVTTIGEKAFMDCAALNYIYLERDTLPGVEDTGFHADWNISKRPVYLYSANAPADGVNPPEGVAGYWRYVDVGGVKTPLAWGAAMPEPEAPTV